jgi:hypothetical protein
MVLLVAAFSVSAGCARRWTRGARQARTDDRRADPRAHASNDEQADGPYVRQQLLDGHGADVRAQRHLIPLAIFIKQT